MFRKKLIKQHEYIILVMTINHIVICGGGPTGFLSYGALKRLHEKGFWKQENIKTIYGSSIGGVMGALITLSETWEALDDYLIKRPWGKAFEKVNTDIMDFIENKGIDGKEFLRIVLEPLLKARDMDIESTMKDFFNKTKIKLVLTATNLNGKNNTLQGELISYETFPDMKIYEALAITSAYPMSFRPVFYGDGCYVDGGGLHNYPVSYCMKETSDETEILAINNYWSKDEQIIRPDTGFLEYIRAVTRKLHNIVDSSRKQPKVTNEISCDATKLSNVNIWLDTFNKKETRKELIQQGSDEADKWLEERNI